VDGQTCTNQNVCADMTEVDEENDLMAAGGVGGDEAGGGEAGVEGTGGNAGSTGASGSAGTATGGLDGSDVQADAGAAGAEKVEMGGSVTGGAAGDGGEEQHMTNLVRIPIKIVRTVAPATTPTPACARAFRAARTF
jgi:hypothetical protein